MNRENLLGAHAMMAPAPRFQGLPRKLDFRTSEGLAYLRTLSADVRLTVLLDGCELNDVLAYDQDNGRVEVSVMGPCGPHAQPQTRKGRVTVTLKAVAPAPKVDTEWLKAWQRMVHGAISASAADQPPVDEDWIAYDGQCWRKTAEGHYEKVEPAADTVIGDDTEVVPVIFNPGAWQVKDDGSDGRAYRSVSLTKKPLGGWTVVEAKGVYRPEDSTKSVSVGYATAGGGGRFSYFDGQIAGVTDDE